MRRFSAERFWARVSKGEGVDDCWVWTMSCSPTGYGYVSVDGVVRRVHRVAWELENGPVPGGPGYHGICVCHRCDNRACVRPSHLFLGTHADNMVDAARKGRISAMKLTAADVSSIRTRLAAGASRTGVAREYGVAITTIQRLNNGKHWRHVNTDVVRRGTP